MTLDPQSGRLALEVELSEPIRGQVISEGSPGLDFEGWLGLYAAIEEARRAYASRKPDRWRDAGGLTDSE